MTNRRDRASDKQQYDKGRDDALRGRPYDPWGDCDWRLGWKDVSSGKPIKDKD